MKHRRRSPSFLSPPYPPVLNLFCGWIKRETVLKGRQKSYSQVRKEREGGLESHKREGGWSDWDPRAADSMLEISAATNPHHFPSIRSELLCCSRCHWMKTASEEKQGMQRRKRHSSTLPNFTAILRLKFQQQSEPLHLCAITMRRKWHRNWWGNINNTRDFFKKNISKEKRNFEEMIWALSIWWKWHYQHKQVLACPFERESRRKGQSERWREEKDNEQEAAMREECGMRWRGLDREMRLSDKPVFYRWRRKKETLSAFWLPLHCCLSAKCWMQWKCDVNGG